MSRKLLEVKHHLSSGCCMWSGIEDIYSMRTGDEVPGAFLFTLSSFGEPIFLKSKNKEKPCMFGFGDGRTRKTYNQIKDILGLEYKISEGRSTEYALNSVKKEIDNGRPVIIGPLDMYHLPYLKMYHHDHIPMHYELMVGYDTEKNCVLIYDCDRENLQELPLEDLLLAWDIEKNDVGNKNGFIRFELPEHPMDEYHLTDICMRKKANRQLCDRPKMIGASAFGVASDELKKWQKQLSKEDLCKAILSLTEYFGRVPKFPNKILGIEEEDMPFDGNFSRLHDILSILGNKYQRADWKESSELFGICSQKMEEITEILVQYYLGENDQLQEIPDRFLEVGKYVEKAYQLIAQYKEEA